MVRTWVRCAAALAAATWGCAAQPPAETTGARVTRGWFAARGMDLLDVVSLRVGAGPGLLVHARVTPYVALGAGQIGSVTAAKPSFSMSVYELGWIKREGGLWTERRVELGLSTFYHYDVEGDLIQGNRATFSEAARGPFDVGADLHLALIGAAAEVRLDEIVDFVGGIFGADVLGDDSN